MERKRRVLRGIIVTVAALLVLFTAAGFAAGNFFYDLALNPHGDKSRVLEADHNEVDYDEAAQAQYWEARDWLDTTGYRQVTMESFDGLALNAYVLENPQPNGSWVVICHGYNSAARVMAEFAQAFYERGFSLLMPDARGCGKSEGDYIGMGWHDRLDLLAWLALLNGTFAPSNIVLYGVSMGASSVLMTSGEALPENVRAVISDCGYTSAWAEFAYQAQALFGIPAFPVLNFCSAVTRIRAGFWLGETDALAQVAKSTIPTLFIHGAEDAFVPAYMAQELYDAAGCEKELLVMPGAGHGGSANQNPDLYWGTVDHFLARYLI